MMNLQAAATRSKRSHYITHKRTPQLIDINALRIIIKDYKTKKKTKKKKTGCFH